jgi:hypothetical protein
LALAGCGSPAKKPSIAEIATYLVQSQPTYLHVSGVSGDFAAAKAAGSTSLPDGSWQIRVQFVLQAQEDLYGPTAASAAMQINFDRTVTATEQFHATRIAAVDQLATRIGLLQPGAVDPEPAIPVTLTTHKGQAVTDHVTLIAQPAGQGWKFVQEGAAAPSSDAIGTPLETLRQANPKTVYVIAGSDQEQNYRNRENQFLQILAKAGKP